MSYLIKQDHDAYSLLGDKKVFQTLKNICSLPFAFFKTFVSTVCLQSDGLREKIQQCTHRGVHLGVSSPCRRGSQNFCDIQRVVGKGGCHSDFFVVFGIKPRNDIFSQEKDRAIDLREASRFSEEICNDLVGIGSSTESPGAITVVLSCNF